MPLQQSKLSILRTVLRMQGADPPARQPRTLFSFNSREDIQDFATGCDSDIGGTSTVHLDLDESPEHNTSIGKPATGKFWGDMRLGVKAGLEGKLRGGYAGFRNKVCNYLPPMLTPGDCLDMGMYSEPLR